MSPPIHCVEAGELKVVSNWTSLFSILDGAQLLSLSCQEASS